MASTPNTGGIPLGAGPGSSTAAQGGSAGTGVSYRPQIQSPPQILPGETQQGHAGRQQSIFHFRSERAQWLAALGVVLALAALIVTWAYSAEAAQVAFDSKRLAVWEAEKDYQLYCQGLEVLS